MEEQNQALEEEHHMSQILSSCIPLTALNLATSYLKTLIMCDLDKHRFFCVKCEIV